MNLLAKEPNKLKEMAVKYKAIVDELKKRKIMSISEYEQLKSLKHVSNNEKSEKIEISGWPSGRSLWDKYIKCRLLMRKSILPLCPSNLTELPSGKGLRQTFEDVSLKLFKNPKHNPGIRKKTQEEIDALDSSDPFLQAEIEHMLKYPFCLLLTANV